MNTFLRTSVWMLLAAAVAACCGLFGWLPVMITVPVALGGFFLVAHSFNSWHGRHAYGRKKRELSKYYPGADGRIAPRRSVVPPLLLGLGVGARDRFRIAGSEVGSERRAPVGVPPPDRRIAA